MKKQPTTCKSDALTRLCKATFIAGILPASLLLLSIQSSRAGSATWNLNPTSGDWFTATNWTPATVPNGPADTATFDVSNTTGVALSANTEVNGIVFNSGASAFTIFAGTWAFYGSLTISGVGITNNSGSTQNFSTAYDESISFTNNATAGSLTAFTMYGPEGCDYGGPGVTSFFGTSSAGSGTFTNEAGTCGWYYPGSSTSFFDTSTASNGTFVNNCNADYYACGSTDFNDSSTAGNATLIANGGGISFGGDATGGTARVEVFGDFYFAYLGIGGHNTPGVTIGSIEGTGSLGTVYTGANNLTVGSNNLSTTFSGWIYDGGSGGSFTKIGTGTLTLTYANTYTGGTTIEGGKLAVCNTTGSGTGSGAVQVNAGTLTGRGIISGAVTVGTGSGPGAVLAPGRTGSKPGTLTIQSALTFNSDATYRLRLNTKARMADKVRATGVAINGAQFSFADRGGLALIPGTVFTVIDNRAATPIAGTFSNLADGSTFIAHGNTYQVNYEGGDGNDLTLTVL